ncbi:MAG: hypothetical protein IJX87_01165 [Clostridia bacterium]|nr:hypothetical protein [Clostridia bacterium]
MEKLVIGMLIGGVAGALLTANNYKMRTLVKKSQEEVQAKLDQLMDDKIREFEDGTEKMKTEMKEKAEEWKEKAEDLKTATKNGVEEVKETVKESVENVKNAAKKTTKKKTASPSARKTATKKAEGANGSTGAKGSPAPAVG